MKISALAKKLYIRLGHKVALLNAPAGMWELLSPMPEGASVQMNAQAPVDLVLLFVQNSEELANWRTQALSALGVEGTLWVAYPKQSSKVATDLNRDQGWQSITDQGFTPNASIAIDDTWSAVRFRHGVVVNEDDLLANQYTGARAAFLPLYEQLVETAQSLGGDVGLTIAWSSPAQRTSTTKLQAGLS